VAKSDIRFGDENIDGLQLRDRLGRRRIVVGPSGEIRGNAASTDGDGKNHNACVIHLRFTFHITLRRFRRRDGS
jgi:hypothetical protein